MQQDILFSHQGQLGIVTLNRPRALNALTLDMIIGLQQQLSNWAQDDNVRAVLVQANHDKAFCVGGDIRWLYERSLAHDPTVMDFFWHEYRLNYSIANYKKPYIALMNGLTMGGGVGISIHGNFPIATERSTVAMPETAIGFFPDIGASYLLANRINDTIGIYIALTGYKLSAAEAHNLGLINYVIPSWSLADLHKAIIESDLSENSHAQISACLNKYAITIPKKTGTIADKFSAITLCFSQPTVEAILTTLAKQNDSWAQSTLQTLTQMSPLSLKVTLAQLKKAKQMSLADCLAMDYNLARKFMHEHDFYEGVRALLIAKDKMPRWQPSRLEAIPQEQVDNFFATEQQLYFTTTH